MLALIDRCRWSCSLLFNMWLNASNVFYCPVLSKSIEKECSDSMFQQLFQIFDTSFFLDSPPFCESFECSNYSKGINVSTHLLLLIMDVLIKSFCSLTEKNSITYLHNR